MGYTITPEIQAYANQASAISGVPQSVILGQAIYESMLGRSNLAKKANNWFGIKGSGTAGTYNGTWAAYSSPADSFAAYGKLMTKSRYASKIQAAKAQNTDAAYINAIVAGGYCPDNGYAEAVLKIIKQNNLDQYNTGGTTTGTITNTGVTQTGFGIQLPSLKSIVSVVFCIGCVALAIFFLYAAFSEVV